jgi:hypothetical protein
MDIISTSNLFESFVRRYSIGTNSRTRFQASFLSALNHALIDLANWMAIDEQPFLESLEDDCELTLRYLPFLSVGVAHFLQQEAEWVKGEARDQYSELNWRRAKGEAADLKTQAKEEAGTYGPWGDSQ